MRRRWTCARWPRAAWSSGLALLVAGCGGGHRAAAPAHGGDALGPLPRLHAGEPCPVTAVHHQVSSFGTGLGDGPAYPVGTFGAGAVLELQRPGRFGSHRWGGQKVLWVERPGMRGPTIIRGRRLDGADLVRFDDGDVPPARVVMPAPEAHRWRDRPSYTRLSAPGCYAYVVTAPAVRRVLVFRAVVIAHWGRGGDRVVRRRAETMERALVEPRGRQAVSSPIGADCRAPTAAERRRDPFGHTRRLFSCLVTEEAGTRRFDVTWLVNGCYVASLQRRPGEHTRGIQACR